MTAVGQAGEINPFFEGDFKGELKLQVDILKFLRIRGIPK